MNKKNPLLFSTLACIWLSVPASAEVVPGTTLSVNFESANIVGSGRNINMHRVPVIDVNSGVTTYYDASFKFTFDPNDGLLFEQISSAAISPPPAITNISPGIYSDQSGRCYALEGPTMLTENRSLYTVRGDNSGSTCSVSVDTFTAQFVTGSATGHPDIGNREIVPFLSDTYLYGFVTNTANSGFTVINTEWDQNELIGVRQSGNQLIIGLFSEGEDNSGNPVDFADPVQSAILTKVTE